MNINDQSVSGKVWTREFIWLLLLGISYFFCLPILRTGSVLGITASEVRAYDLIFLGGFLVLVLPRINQILSTWGKYSMMHRYLLYWLLVALFGLIVTLMTRESRFIIGVVRYLRFFSFAIVFILGFLILKERRQLRILFDALLTTIALVAIIGTLQGFGSFPILWPEYYSVYWQSEDGYLATATLSPNHTHYSLIMAMGVVMVMVRQRIFPRDFLPNSLFAVSSLPMVYSMIASKGRSGWLVLGVYFAYLLVISRTSRLWIVTAISIFSTFFFYNQTLEAGNSTLGDILRYRSVTTVKETKKDVFDALEEEDKTLIERIDDNRWFIYTNAVSYLFDNPSYLLVGAGFQNASRGIGGVALGAHNAYINVVAEHGIGGLVIYLLFFYHMYSFGSRTKRSALTRASYYLANHWQALFMGLLVANFFGEIIYPGRALFSFLGSFFITAVVFLHPAWNHVMKGKTNV